jgi:hypothetical protein
VQEAQEAGQEASQEAKQGKYILHTHQVLRKYFLIL